MNREEWILTAKNYLVTVSGEWEENNALDYCESLYESYVEENSEFPFSPEDAVDEDMTYWDY